MVKSTVELTVNVPVACNRTAVPEAIVGDGVTAVDTSDGGCTVRVPLTVWLP